MRRKLFIQMSGAPGSGKSTIARLLADSLDAIVINHDLIKSFFLENLPDSTFDQSAKLTYGLQWTLAEDWMKQTRPVIIDSICNYKETLDRGTLLAKQYGYEYKYIECKVDDIDVLDQRLRSRASVRSQRRGVADPALDATNANMSSEDYRAQYINWMDNPYRPAHSSIAILVDSSHEPHQCLEELLKVLIES
ncbi:hypothetical protein VTL71DRAFT_9415 [Oculimacula yallundae]|uniref:ATP-binding protein n=1 Tax=Oculimacula yallundae TaxID=86028 RepID=A0ABR4BVM6_9HELO